MLKPDIAERLKNARQNKGFKSARSFANRSNIPLSTYAQHESGCRAISTENLMYYCKLLEVDPRLILEDTELSLESPSESHVYDFSKSNETTINTICDEELAYVDLSIFSKVFIAASKYFTNNNKKDEVVTFCYKVYDEIIALPKDDRNLDFFITLSIESLNNNSYLENNP